MNKIQQQRQSSDPSISGEGWDRRVIGSEVSQMHTHLLRVSLAIEESRAYWSHLPEISVGKDQSSRAFEERWFGSKSMARVKTLLKAFVHRYEQYPRSLAVLIRWQPQDPVTRQNICHWHLQLSDPLYRRFTGTFLEQRRSQQQTGVGRDVVAQWLQQELLGRAWSVSTTLRMATGLIASAAEAGLCEAGTGERTLSYPKVTDEALSYWLYFLRHLEFQGTLLDNPYFASVGLMEGFLEQRLRKLPGLQFHRMGDLHELNWQYLHLWAWAEAELGLVLEGI